MGLRQNKKTTFFLVEKYCLFDVKEIDFRYEDAFRGRGLSLLVITFLQGLKAHAIPAGSFAL